MDCNCCTLLFCLTTFIANGVATEIDPLIDIFPPKWHPGDVLDSTSRTKIESALIDVDRAAGLLEMRTVAVGLSSLNGTLSNPRYKMRSGHGDSTMPYSFTTGQTGLLLFTKSISVSGVYGVVVYDIEGTDYMIAIMFSVPMNTLTYNNKFNFKIYKNDVPVNKDLVTQMYKHAGAWRAIGYEERSEYGIHVRGTMSDNPHSRLIVWMDTSAMDASLGPSLHAECASKILGKRCKQECTLGWCWTKNKCKNSDECTGKMYCDGSCKSAYMENGKQ